MISTYEVQMRGGNFGDNVIETLCWIDQSFFHKRIKNCLFDDVNNPLRFTATRYSYIF